MPRKTCPAELPWPLNCKEWKATMKSLRLPPQQVRICEFLVQGMTDVEIGDEMKLQRSTLRSYQGRLNRRLQTKNRVGLVVALLAEMWEQRR